MPNPNPNPEDLALFGGCLGTIITGLTGALLSFGIGLAAIGLALGSLTGAIIGYKLAKK